MGKEAITKALADSGLPFEAVEQVEVDRKGMKFWWIRR